MNTHLWWKGASLALALLLPSGAMAASESALMQAPARNAAIIAKVPGFKAADLDLYLGQRRISEGVVIRKSFIRDGKIVIPPAGLYYSSRIASIGTMTNIEVMLLGKRYSEVDESFEYLVLKNRTMKKGDSINLLPDGSRALQFVNGNAHPYGNSAGYSSLRIMKSSGNFYGTNFQVAADPTLVDVNSGKFHGLGLSEGRHPVTASTGEPLQHKSYYGASIYPSGKSYLIVGKTSANEVEVKEFATPSLTEIWLTSEPRVSGAFKAGDTVKVGSATVKILSVGKDSAKISLTQNGKETVKEFKNILDPHALDYLPSSPAERAKWQLASADGKARVQVAMLHPKGALTADGKIRLDMFSGIFSIKNPQQWPGDPRFTVRPDT
ncbi:hypothetical protein [Mailhella sp.]|uniref:hypothetical protein n=1 Tax=Mailhella sp. TaxID=1981029 RepID=UPI003AB77A4F